MVIALALARLLQATFAVGSVRPALHSIAMSAQVQTSVLAAIQDFYI